MCHGSSCLPPPFSLAPCRVATLADEDVLLGLAPPWELRGGCELRLAPPAGGTGLSQSGRDSVWFQSLDQGTKGGEGTIQSLLYLYTLGPSILTFPLYKEESIHSLWVSVKGQILKMYPSRLRVHLCHGSLAHIWTVQGGQGDMPKDKGECEHNSPRGIPMLME